MEGLRKRHGFVIAGGMGEMKGKILRIGHMGNFRQKDLEECVRRIIELRG
jgi:aspartate aminotransferase-like enzyme